MPLSSYEYIQRCIELFKIFLAFVHYIEGMTPVRQRIPREHFNDAEREMHSVYNELMEFVRHENDREFRKFTRISTASYQLLLALIRDKLQKYSARQPISAECRLLLTLTYLAYNSPRNLLTMAFRLGRSTLRSVITETVESIVTELSPLYLKEMNKDNYYEIAEEVRKSTNLPNCVGTLSAIDIKPERKQCPFVLLACSNMQYELYNVDVAMADDMQERNNIVSRLQQEEYIEALPDDMQCPDTGVLIPCYFVTSNAFPFVKHTVRPYPGKTLTPQRQYLNDCLRFCSDHSDNAFGVLLHKWKVLQSRIGGLNEVAQNIIKACVVLHNFAIKHDPMYINALVVDHYDESTMEFKEGIWRQSINLPKSKAFNNRNNANRDAFDNRDLLKDFLNNERR